MRFFSLYVPSRFSFKSGCKHLSGEKKFRPRIYVFHRYVHIDYFSKTDIFSRRAEIMDFSYPVIGNFRGTEFRLLFASSNSLAQGLDIFYSKLDL